MWILVDRLYHLSLASLRARINKCSDSFGLTGSDSFGVQGSELVEALGLPSVAWLHECTLIRVKPNDQNQSPGSSESIARLHAGTLITLTHSVC